ncbi:MBL fold metallo-hydrolase [Microvirga lotononidis]|uniref:Metal-dependent hydrolase, beta-lactamase superfamily I n=1 Tax=Microvirga lotononidis TaxID=864069 RepID=I4Z0J3_9HYPH|nr:MBL fold metallo-hydrolase [Microvirga lotononidis]EIM29735.1 metal-dependent hydrolase, beta-lactamase superfamily I [Microvirga lotononidis]WQO26963.1 MBL fold metallo-hydrolase [Microvirga lotononidis]
MTLKVTILGCGSSAGVPRVGVGWGACDPANPKNRRHRCSILVERIGPGGAKTTVLVDTGPDLREQLLGADVRHLDAVLITHEHADHIHGIDDLRPLALVQRQRIPVYADRMTSELLQMRFGYCFETPAGSSYPPILKMRHLLPGTMTAIQGAGGTVEALPFRMIHGDIDALGFRFGKIAYAPDVSRMPEESLPSLEGLDVLILDALRYTPHPTHFSVSEALELIGRVKPKRAILTNLHTDLDYEILRSKLPRHIDPAYDGLQIEVA